MASTEEILKDARELGKKVATHDAAQKLERAIKSLQGDTEAQRLLTDFNRAVQAIGEKEAQGKPIEVADKHKIEELQNKVVRNLVLRNFQLAQMDYLDLMRKVDEAMAGQAPGATAPEAGPVIGGGGPRLVS
ncbi:MAG: YlbF family regulator [Phycisphaeraceae bacterium]